MVTRTTGSPTVGWGGLDGVALLLGISTLALVHLIRQRLPSREPGQSEEQWWNRHLGRAVLLWSLLELAAVIGAVTLMATGHLAVFAALALFGLGGLLAYRPTTFGG